MNRTQAYFDAYRNHRNELRGAWAAYDKELTALEPYRGSAGYTGDVERLTKQRDEQVAQINTKYAKEFDGILAGMRLSVDMMPLPVTTDEQMNALAVLKMREKVTREELRQAARAVQGNALALGVVHEVAAKNGYRAVMNEFGGESVDSTKRCIDTLTKSARELVRLTKVDARVERGIAAMKAHGLNGSGVNELRGYRVDTDIDTVGELLGRFGNVHDIDGFSEMVNREL